MNIPKIIGITFIAAALILTSLYGQWGPTGCPTVAGQTQSEVKFIENIGGDLNWYESQAKQELYLYNGNKQIGLFSLKSNNWYPIETNGVYGLPTYDCPYALPRNIIQNFGVNLKKCEGKGCTICGQPVSIEEAKRMIQESKIPNNSNRFRLTVISDSKETRDNIRKLYKEKFDAEYKARISDWYVNSQHWSLKDTETGKTIFKNTGAVVIYFTAPDGKVLHRQDDFDGEGTFFAAIRKAVKDYDMSKDPDLRKPTPPVDPVKPPVDPIKPGPITPVAPDWSAIWELLKLIPTPFYIIAAALTFLFKDNILGWFKKFTNKEQTV